MVETLLQPLSTDVFPETPTDVASFFVFVFCALVLLFFSNYATPLVWSDNSQWLLEKRRALILLCAVNVKSLFVSHDKALQTLQAAHQQPLI